MAKQVRQESNNSKEIHFYHRRHPINGRPCGFFKETGRDPSRYDEENERIKQARKKKEKYKPKLLSNGDTPKELLARSRFVLAKKQHQWTENQAERASILFKQYPELERAYLHVIQLRNIYENKQKLTAIEPLKKWIDQSRNMGIKQFFSVANTIENHFETILNFFHQRSTNANAESFNSKIKLFRANQRGVVDTKFFLFRLAKLFA